MLYVGVKTIDTKLISLVIKMTVTNNYYMMIKFCAWVLELNNFLILINSIK